MPTADDPQRANQVTSITRIRINKRVDEILDLATRDRAAAIRAARRLQKWLSDQIATGRGTSDLENDLQDVGYLIDILVKT